MKRKRIVAVAAALCLTGFIAGVARADVPFDAFTLTVTPAGDRGVIINTTTFDLGTVTLGMSTTTAAIPVTTTGTVSPIEYTMRGALSGGWSLSTDGTASSQNELEVRCLFNSTSPGSFGSGTTNLLITTDKDAGNLGADPGDFEGDVDVDDMALLNTKNLFVKMVLPPTSSTGSQQSLVVTVTAEPAD